MAVSLRQKPQNPVDIGDITNNLLSLQFESALSEEEQEILILRKRSHALTATACAQAMYFVTLLNEARQIHGQLKNPDNRRASRLISEGVTRNAIRIGIIGGGRLGSHLANTLISFSDTEPSNIKISTRRPETLSELQDKGVACVNNNREVASSSHLLFLCILPSQLPMIAEELRGHISPVGVIYSFISAVPASRLRQLLDFNNIIRPEFKWDEKDKTWDYTKDMATMLSTREILIQTSPLVPNQTQNVIWTSEKFAEALVYAFINMCTTLRLKRDETVDIVNAVVLGDSPTLPINVKLTESDITKLRAEQNKLFPKFDLTTVTTRETPITKKLLHTPEIRQAFNNRFCDVFQQLLSWKNAPFSKK